MIGVANVVDAMSRDLFPVVADYFEVFSKKAGGRYATSWDSERFYQWICLKALTARLDKIVVADRYLNDKCVDLLILDNEDCVMAIEMKRYYSESGESEIPLFIRDIDSLITHADVNERLFVVTTIHAKSNRTANIQFLSSIMQIPKEWFLTKFQELNDSLVFEIIALDINSDFERHWKEKSRTKFSSEAICEVAINLL